MSVRWVKIVLLLAASTGCASIADHHYEKVAKRRASAAWKCVEKCVPQECNNCDFEKGYKAGYLDVSLGGSGACPPVPPNCYWSADYQCTEGLGKVNMWFCGFNQGAQHAIRDGRGCLHNIPSAAQSSCCQTSCPSNTYPEMNMESGFTQVLLPLNDSPMGLMPQPVKDPGESKKPVLKDGDSKAGSAVKDPVSTN